MHQSHLGECVKKDSVKTEVQKDDKAAKRHDWQLKEAKVELKMKKTKKKQKKN